MRHVRKARQVRQAPQAHRAPGAPSAPRAPGALAAPSAIEVPGARGGAKCGRRAAWSWAPQVRRPRRACQVRRARSARSRQCRAWRATLAKRARRGARGPEAAARAEWHPHEHHPPACRAESALRWRARGYAGLVVSDISGLDAGTTSNAGTWPTSVLATGPAARWGAELVSLRPLPLAALPPPERTTPVCGHTGSPAMTQKS